jgi:lysophospholipase L1-like esterase
MVRRNILSRAALALVAAAAFTGACNDDMLNSPEAVDTMFARYVAIGNSLTAGFQSGGINDSTQRQAYPVLLAADLETEFTIPELNQPGCPAPYVDVFTQQRVGGVPSTVCALRASPTPEQINNVAVPGAASIDATSNLNAASDPNTLTTLILGGRTQVQAAAAIQPTFVSVAIGSNDILGALLDAANPGDPALITSPADFATRYGALMDSLDAFGTIEGGVLIGVQPVMVNATTLSAAYFSAGAAWQQFEAYMDGLTTPFGFNAFDVDAGCATAFVPFPVGGAALSVANARVDSVMAGTLAPGSVVTVTLSCPDNLAITLAEFQNIMATLAQYNGTIQQEATARGWAYFDPAPVFTTMAATPGVFRPFPAFDSNDPQHTTQPFGAALSRDGIHWSAMLQAAIADALLDEIVDHYDIELP